MNIPKRFLSFARGFVFLGFAFVLLSSPAFAQFDIASYFPPGVTTSNVTPEQFSQAVFDAVRENPEKAAEIASMSFESVVKAGRFTETGGKQGADPDGSRGDPTVEEWANMATEAATRAAPAMASQIASAMGSALSTTQAAVASGAITPAGATTDGSGGTGTGGGGGGGAPVPPPFGGGGGGGTSTAPSGSS